MSLTDEERKINSKAAFGLPLMCLFLYRFAKKRNEFGVVVPAGEEVCIVADGEDRHGMGRVCMRRPAYVGFLVEQRDAGVT